MSGKIILVFALLVALLVSGAAGEARETNVLQKLVAKQAMVNDSTGRQSPAPRTHFARVERRTHLSEDEREIMTKQIMQAISELMNSECMSDRDYLGWVDFGRRDTE